MAGTKLPRPLLLGAGIAAGVMLGSLALLASRTGAPAPRPAVASVQTAQSAFAQLGQGVDDVALTDAGGSAVTWGAQKGKPRAVFFGFTHCPEICPMTMSELDAALDAIGPAGNDLQIDFVSIDPARDTPAALSAYFASFDRPIRAFTGTDAEIARLAGAYRAAYQRQPLEGDDYTMNHTTLVYLVGADGVVRDAVSYGAPQTQMIAQLRRLLGLDA